MYPILLHAVILMFHIYVLYPGGQPSQGRDPSDLRRLWERAPLNASGAASGARGRRAGHGTAARGTAGWSRRGRGRSEEGDLYGWSAVN